MASSPETLVRPASHAVDAAQLARGVEALGLVLRDDAEPKLLAYVALLAKWNRVYNLTSVDDPRDMLAVHLLDSLAIVPLLDRFAPQSILDVGSGAGLPGIPLAIVRPAIRVTTIDAVAKKIAFQRQCKSTLRLDNLTPIHERVEVLTLGESPGIIVSRAFSNLATMLRAVEPLAGADTVVLAMKGAIPTDELRDVPSWWTTIAIEPLDVPFLGAQRCAVLLGRA